ncbi:PH domain-containing protein [Demequina sp. NBRC 110057]|uniref:PH domain-containing protein n=1 Tax=Demequina sp. NBRC 110057 TaxID=1570346 RepID=UPI000A006AF5|nr:PH domain-containing protein [Demequina sp. NBRC 110057]
MEIYRSQSSRVWGWLCVGIGGTILLVQLIGSGLEQIHVALGMALAFAGMGAAAFLRPAVAVGDDHVELRNVTQTVVVPFARLDGLEAHWSLELVGDDGTKAGSFAAPARSGRDRLKSPDEGKSAEVAGLVTAAWDAYRSRPTPLTAPGEPLTASAPATGPAFTRRIDWAGVGCLVVAVGGLALALLG